MRHLVLGACLALGGVGSGCDGIGQPLVGVKVDAGGLLFRCTRERPQCEPPPAPRLDEPLPEEASLPACALPESSSPVFQFKNLRLEACSLRFDDGSAPVELNQAVLRRVRVELRGEAFLKLSNSELSQVLLLGPIGEGGPSGRVEITHSTVTASRIRVFEAAIDSSTLSGCGVQAEELKTVAVDIIGSELRPTRASIAGSHLRNSALRDCRETLIAGSTLRESRLSPCVQLHQIYDTQVIKSSLDGLLEIDKSNIEDSVFGVRAPTQLLSWFGALENVVFCEQALQGRFSAGTLVCAQCKGPLADPKGDVCTEAASETSFEDNPCASMVAPPECGEFPRRTRQEEPE